MGTVLNKAVLKLPFCLFKYGREKTPYLDTFHAVYT